MKYCSIIVGIISSCLLRAQGENPQQISRIIVYNNHKITQTVTANSNEYEAPNRYPGHTKNETTTHGVDTKSIDQVKAGNASQQPAPVVDNNHVISQNATYATTKTRTMDPLLPDETKPANNEHHYTPWNQNNSWLMACIPPIIVQSPLLQYFLATVGLSYTALIAKLLHTSYFVLTKTSTWSCWHSEISLEAMSVQEKQYAQELFTTLQNQYIHAPVNACFLSPLVHFINDVDAELAQLITFISLHKTIDKFNIAFMFPKQEKELHSAREKIKRLEYFKTIIINWVGEYKV